MGAECAVKYLLLEEEDELPLRDKVAIVEFVLTAKALPVQPVSNRSRGRRPAYRTMNSTCFGAYARPVFFGLLSSRRASAYCEASKRRVLFSTSRLDCDANANVIVLSLSYDGEEGSSAAAAAIYRPARLLLSGRACCTRRVQ